MTSPVKYNPGELLRNLLEEMYPRESMGIFQKIDSDFEYDGEYAKILYRSQLNYLTRRLISTGGFYKRRYDPGSNPNNKYINEFRRYLRERSKLNSDCIDRIVDLVIQCLEMGDFEISDGTKNRYREKGRQRSTSCYICGETIDYDRRNDNDYIMTLDHSWPKSLGGVTNDSNLIIACKSCNTKYKKDMIDYADYHYEIASFTADSYSKYLNLRPKVFDIAVFAKTDFCCFDCERPAHQVGKLYVGRIDLEDGWHLLNLAAFCQQHKPE